jgi:hypothetical protein
MWNRFKRSRAGIMRNTAKPSRRRSSWRPEEWIGELLLFVCVISGVVEVLVSVG